MSDLDNNSDEDLTKELEPLAYYVADRKRVLREGLKTLRGKRLEAMIPPVLKSWERPRLESACLNILEDLDDEKLLAILDGRIGTASVAAVEQHEHEPEEPVVVKEKGKKTKNKVKKLKSVNTIVEIDEPKKKKKKKAVATEETLDALKAAKLKRKKKLLKAKKLKEKLKKKKKAAAAAVTAADGEPSAAAPHKSLMELLELEYRAKAIKALLRSQGQSVPDLPMDLEDEEENNETPDNSKVNSKKNTNTAAKNEINGKVPGVSVTKQKKTKSSKTATSAETDTPKTKAVSAKPASTSNPEVIPLASSQKCSNSAAASSSPRKSVSPQKKPEVKKKAVIDMIDDALNSSFSEISESPSPLSPKTLQPASVIIEACVSKGPGAEEDLRSKLLRKYQQQKEAATTVPTLRVEPVVSKKKRKKNKQTERTEDEEEDILDLHPRELSLTDEEQGGVQTPGENESSGEDEELEEEENEEETIELVPANNSEQKLSTGPSVPDEELDYDNTEDEEETDEMKETNETKNKESADEENSSQETSLWADVVEDGTGSEPKVTLNDNESTQESVSREGPPSDNSRSEVFSETARDDVFEKAVPEESKVKVGTGIVFGGMGMGKRKLTFRIDPARIKALEEQAVEEEAKRAEERRRLEEEERLRRLEEEPEEGEIDSNEEDDFCGSEDKNKNQRNSQPLQMKRKPLEKSRSPSSSPPQKQRITDTRERDSLSDSEDSQNSSSYYGKRRTYKRKTTVASPNRDFGKYSPERAPESSNKDEKEAPKKRPSSPVDFITQFSDMEPVSDDDDSNQSQPRKKVGPVQGCATKPVNAASGSGSEDEAVGKDLNKKSVTPPGKTGSGNSESEENNEEDENQDELPKPVTWYERWAQSHGMSKVVKANKIHRKVKTKLKQDKSATKKKQQPQVPKVPEPSVEAEPIIGSIEEYEKLFGKKVIVKSGEHEGDNEFSKQPEDDEEEEADDLWGDIMGGS